MKQYEVAVYCGEDDEPTEMWAVTEDEVECALKLAIDAGVAGGIASGRIVWREADDTYSEGEA